MTPSTASVNATFFYITDTRSTDRTEAAHPLVGHTSSSLEHAWSWVKKAPLKARRAS